MRIIDQEFVPDHPLADLAEHPDNPNRGDDSFVGQLIDDNGFYGAIIVQRSTHRILAGNTRYRAARDAGATSMPVMLLDVDDDEAMRIMLGDNRGRDAASTDTSVLASLLETLAASEAGLTGTGYGADELSDLLIRLNTPEPAPIDPADRGSDGWDAPESKPFAVSLMNDDHAFVCTRLDELAERYGTTSRSATLVAILRSI